MRYTPKYKRELPRKDETKVVRKFAWLPVYINDTWFWLEYYVVLYFYEVKMYTYKIESQTKVSPVGNWVELAKGKYER